MHNFSDVQRRRILDLIERVKRYLYGGARYVGPSGPTPTREELPSQLDEVIRFGITSGAGINLTPLSRYRDAVARHGLPSYSGFASGWEADPPDWHLVDVTLNALKTLAESLPAPPGWTGRAAEILLALRRKGWTSAEAAVSREVIANAVDGYLTAGSLSGAFARLKGAGLIAATGPGAAAGTYLTQAGVREAQALENCPSRNPGDRGRPR